MHTSLEHLADKRMLVNGKTAKNMRHLICRNPRCGRSFHGGPRAWYCPMCRAVRKAEQSAACKRRKRRGEVRDLGSLDKCTVCGGQYVVRSANQRYCPTCAPEAIAAVDREQGLAYYAANKTEINPARNAARRAARRDR